MVSVRHEGTFKARIPADAAEIADGGLRIADWPQAQKSQRGKPKPKPSQRNLSRKDAESAEQEWNFDRMNRINRIKSSESLFSIHSSSCSSCSSCRNSLLCVRRASARDLPFKGFWLRIPRRWAFAPLRLSTPCPSVLRLILHQISIHFNAPATAVFCAFCACSRQISASGFLSTTYNQNPAFPINSNLLSR